MNRAANQSNGQEGQKPPKKQDSTHKAPPRTDPTHKSAPHQGPSIGVPAPPAAPPQPRKPGPGK